MFWWPGRARRRVHRTCGPGVKDGKMGQKWSPAMSTEIPRALSNSVRPGPSDFLFRITPFFLFWFWGGVGSMVAHTCCPNTTKGGLSYQFQESLAIQYHTRKEEKMSLCVLVFQNHDHSSVWVLQKPEVRIFSYTLQLKRKKERKRPIMTVGNKTAPDTYWVYQVSGTVGRVLPPLCVPFKN